MKTWQCTDRLWKIHFRLDAIVRGFQANEGGVIRGVDEGAGVNSEVLPGREGPGFHLPPSAKSGQSRETLKLSHDPVAVCI